MRHYKTPTEKRWRITGVFAKVVIHQPLVSPDMVTSDCPPTMDRTRDRLCRLPFRLLLNFPLHLFNHHDKRLIYQLLIIVVIYFMKVKLSKILEWRLE